MKALHDIVELIYRHTVLEAEGGELILFYRLFRKPLCTVGGDSLSLSKWPPSPQSTTIVGWWRSNPETGKGVHTRLHTCCN